MTQLKKMLLYIAAPVAACFILFILEQVLMVDYWTKTAAKLVLFLSIPMAARFLYQAGSFPNLQKNSLKERLLPGLLIGIDVIAIIITAYFLFCSRIDSVSIMAELSEKSKITKETYLYTGLYITLVNSFLEEFFFRKYIFLNLYSADYRKLAYIASALLFSVYHLAIFNTWFSPVILLLALAGLFAAGLILDYIVAKTNSLLSSWAVHIAANIAIIGIGYTWLI